MATSVGRLLVSHRPDRGGAWFLLVVVALSGSQCVRGREQGVNNDTGSHDVAVRDDMRTDRSNDLPREVPDSLSVGDLWEVSTPDVRRESPELVGLDNSSWDLLIRNELNCGELAECLALCSNDASCSSGCIEDAEPGAEALLWDLYDCVNPGSWGCNEYECWAVGCAEELYLCHGSDGDRTCAESYLCGLGYISEGEMEWEYSGQCAGLRTLEDFSSLLHLELCALGQTECIGNTESPGDACAESIWKNCLEEVTACTTGVLPCSELTKCLFDELDENDLLQASMTCVVGGTVQDQTLFIGVAGCLAEHCGYDSGLSCLQEALADACVQQQTACEGGSGFR